MFVMFFCTLGTKSGRTLFSKDVIYS